ncbi:MAG: hypothetical protein K2K32_00685, partial [Muribaculaceae bacterium]|nr:hypothetical protein [Muribaculaceae bacterium]
DKILQINIDDNPMLHTIFEYVINKDRIHDKVYSVILNDYYGGTIVEIIELENATLDGSFYWDGYALVGDNIFAINTIDSNIYLNYVSPEHSKTFKMDRDYNPETLMKSMKWFFFILGDKYARYSPEVGWIWSDGKPDE